MPFFIVWALGPDSSWKNRITWYKTFLDSKNWFWKEVHIYKNCKVVFGLTLSSDLYSPPNCAFFISHLRCLIQAGNWHDKLIDYEHLIVFPREHLNRKMLNPVTFLAGVLILAVHMLKPPVSTLNTELERFFFFATITNWNISGSQPIRRKLKDISNKELF